MILYVCVNSEDKVIRKKIITVVIIASIMLLLVQVQKFTTIIQDRYKLNKLDYEVSMKIIDKIVYYEKHTHIKISKIEIYEDKINYLLYQKLI